MTDRSEDNYRGMTTNERLFVAGLLSRYDQACARREADTVRALLRSVHVDEPSIEAIVRGISGR